MADPLWFLENLEENESKSHQKDFTLNYDSSQNEGQKEWNAETINSSSMDKSVQLSPQSQENSQARNFNENKATRVLDLLKDEESLKAALQNSLLESLKNGKNPEIRITLNTTPESSTSDIKLEGNNSTFDNFSQNENSNMSINLDKKINGEENLFITDSSNGQNTEVDETSSNSKPTVYVILPPEQNNQLTLDPGTKRDGGSSQQYKEVGSSIINLNDLLSSQPNVLSNGGEIAANVDLSSVIGSSEGMPKVELVIKLKDERVKTDQTAIPENTTLKTYSEKEIARLKELLKNSATLESLDNQIQSGKTVGNVPIRAAQSEWADTTTDTYVRRDGARCSRTVWTSPRGRRVETRCVREDRGPRGRRPRTLDSFWSDFDSDIDRIFSYANRFF